MELKKTRILHISKYYYPFLGGTEQVARDIVQAMIGTGAEQKVICFNEDATDGKVTCNHGETVTDLVDDIDVVRCGYSLKLSSQALSLTYGRELKKIMTEFKPNVVILHYPNPFVTHYLMKYKEEDFKLLVYWHLDITKQSYLKHLFHKQNLDLIGRADKILGATPKHLNESFFTPQFGDKKYILPYMIDENSLVMTEAEIQEGNRIKEKYKGKTLGFFIGRHVPYKGLEYLIKASNQLGDNDIHFLIAGSGELTDQLKEQAKNDSKVEFLGRITNSQRRSFLYACDIVCFPSITRNEGFGLALAEGMYFGRPAVTFTIPGSGVNYVNIDGKTGIECPNCDYKAYADALKELCENSSLREQYGNNARNRVLENFTSKKFKENCVNLIKAL
jgi:rhamnosyl/mannosyltransferase